MILKGNIFITSDIDVVYNYPLGPQNKIISLDEDGVLQEDDQNIISGSCLLPPINAKIAECDGDEFRYEMIYKEHLLESYQQQFIGALLAALYKNMNILLFLPEIGYSYTRDKLLQFLFQLYGVQLGVMEFNKSNGLVNVLVPCCYDPSAAPIWLNLIYEARVIGPYEYLLEYPQDADIRVNEKIIQILINDLKPYGETINKKVELIVDLHKQLHKNPNVRLAIHSLI